MSGLPESTYRYLPLAAVIFLWLCRWIWKTAPRIFKSFSAKKWPAAEARIESFYVTHENSDRRQWYRLVLQYSYVIASERYSGSLPLGTVYSDRDSAAEAGRAWVGEKIQIRYKPSEPATSIWLAQDGAPEDAFVSASGTDEGIIDLELNK